MSTESVTALRVLLTEIESSAARATTRAEVVNLRALWASIKRVVDIEEGNG